MADSFFERFFKLGTAAGRLTFSLWGSLGEAAFDPKKLQAVAAAIESLGKLKGAPMKIGQMLSLQEGLFPPEVQAAFASLRQDATPLPENKIRELIAERLKNADQIQEIQSEPIAAASLGQVHRATLKNGQQVVIKIQYPGMEKAIINDMKILKGFLVVLQPFLGAPAEMVESELKLRFLEEIDYEREANSLNEYRTLFANAPWLRIPRLFPEFCTKDILMLEYVPSMRMAEAAAGSAESRLQWAKHLMELIVTAAFTHKFLHADPNVANLGFLENGALVLYDFGCMKRIPDPIANSYREITRDVLTEKHDLIPGRLKSAGIHLRSGEPVSQKFLEPLMKFYADVFPDRESVFAEMPDIFNRIWDISTSDFYESRNIVFPQDIIFIHRTFAGHFGNLRALKPLANWKKELLAILDRQPG